MCQWERNEHAFGREETLSFFNLKERKHKCSCQLSAVERSSLILLILLLNSKQPTFPNQTRVHLIVRVQGGQSERRMLANLSSSSFRWKCLVFLPTVYRAKNTVPIQVWMMPNNLVQLTYLKSFVFTI